MKTVIYYLLKFILVLLLVLMPYIAIYLAGVYIYDTWEWIPLAETSELRSIGILCLAFILFSAFCLTSVTKDDRREK